MKPPASPVYLDYNATTPHDPEVIAAMLPFLETHFGNPSSSHRYGAVARRAVAEAREQVAELLGCEPHEVLFTSGGTESNNYAIRGAAMALRSRGRHIITSRIEHPAVTEVCRQLESDGFEITWLPVDETALVQMADLEAAIRSDTILVTLMHANNEVGTVQPIEEAAVIVRRRGVLFHTDAAQSVGKIPVDVRSVGVDLLTITGHKLYAPKGVGALYVRSGVEIDLLMQGAGQEMGRRAGTENVLEIVGLGKACEIVRRHCDQHNEVMRLTREELERGLLARVKDARVNGDPMHRLPNTLSISFPGLNANELLAAIEPSVAASAGAACHSGEVHTSHVLRAMNVPHEWARGTLRLSTGKHTSAPDVRIAVDAICEAVGRLRHAG